MIKYDKCYNITDIMKKSCAMTSTTDRRNRIPTLILLETIRSV